ncbi:related to cytochrome P450 CYP2 subfamily [Armillaria ostoyae]|uniref:Related to cytochrome P450 CYP2 subfamily n=1 Tax=Armillaria ostoyae TaxID=47428 RepID=A0A284RM04_ARMOS|nr:related to cytochrome P450 CYP2 subfamily [Armillaria ostoyae]
MISTLLATFLVFGVLLLHRRLSLNRRHLPPGPKGLPLIGNLWDVPAEYPWLTYAQWAATYGDILYLDTPGNPTVVLNSAQAAADLFEKRSRNYSDRPGMVGRYYNVSELIIVCRFQHDEVSRMGEYDGAYEIFRPVEAGTSMFSVDLRAVPAYYPVQMKATSVLLQQLHKSPDAFVHHVRHHAGSVIMKIVYGFDVNPNGDQFVGLADRALESARIIGNMGTFAVDFIPSLKYLPRWFPGANFLNLARNWSKDVRDMKQSPFEYASKSLAKGDAPSSFVSENLTKMKQFGTPESAAHLDIIRDTAAVAFAAGADTTVSVVLSVMLAFLLYPEVQAKAQAELDAVVGPTRLPNFDDRPQLPYIEAILSEALRWNPVVPTSIAHRNVQEDVYRGYYIPAGATIIGNAWAILHDEKDYPNPLVFDPERFMSAEGKEPQPEPIAAFGFGRRICPGRYFASNTAWIAIASMASTLSFTKAVDSEGRVIEPSNTFTDGFVR